jgi:hypothetical protein
MLSLPPDTLGLICAEKETARAFGRTCKYAAEFVRGLFRVVVTSGAISLLGKYKKYDYAINNHNGAIYLMPTYCEDILYKQAQDAPYDLYCGTCSGYGTSIPHVIVKGVLIHVCDLGIAILGGTICAFDAKLADEFTYIRAAFENIYNIDAAVMAFRGALPNEPVIFLRKEGDLTHDPVPPTDGCMLMLSPV